MNCNYFKDNRKEIEANWKDPIYSALCGTDDIPLFSCHTGICEYEPTQEEKEIYCTNDFLHCPRMRLKLYKI